MDVPCTEIKRRLLMVRKWGTLSLGSSQLVPRSLGGMGLQCSKLQEPAVRRQPSCESVPGMGGWISGPFRRFRRTPVLGGIWREALSSIAICIFGSSTPFLGARTYSDTDAVE